ncbi:hypothetical protein Hesp01_26900 [Herbidospora sp. NBRC 101105]|nr:hypothetical protein Hesp01_26900 [Herbidospora sp. NBRC 101105]
MNPLATVPAFLFVGGAHDVAVLQIDLNVAVHEIGAHCARVRHRGLFMTAEVHRAQQHHKSGRA